MGMTDQDRALLVTFVICVVVLLICQLVFEFLRKKVRVVYEPRTLPDLAPEPLEPAPSGLFAWIIPTFKISQREVLEKRGLDVLVYLRMLESCFYAFLFMALWSWAVLAPINGTASNKDLPAGDPVRTEGLPIVFMSNIETGSYRLIAHAITVWIFTLLLLGLYWRDYRRYWQDCMWCFGTKQRQNFSTIVTGVPYPSGARTNQQNVKKREEQIRRQFETIFGSRNVYQVDVVWTEPELKKKVAKYNQFVRKLEKAYVVYQEKNERPTHKLGPLGLWGEQVDSIEYYNKELNNLKQEIEMYQSQETVNMSKAAVITFGSRKVAAFAAHGVIDRHQEKWRTFPAGEPDDVFWEWLDVKEKIKFVRRVLVNIFIFLLIFFWAIPVMFAASLANLQAISEVSGFGWVGDIVNANATVGAFLQGFLPALVVIIFFALLQLIVTSVSAQEAYPKRSLLDQVVSWRMYLFQLFNVFLVYTIAGTFFTQVNNLINNVTFGSIIDLLAQSIPQQALFFSNFIMLKAFIGTSLLILQPGRLIVRWIFRRFLLKTPREFREVDKPGAFNYAGAVSMSFLILAIALSYSVMNPFVVTFAAFYFGYLYVNSKYMLLYVFKQGYDGRGFLFTVVRRCLVVAMVIFQVLMIGVFLIYKLIAAAIIVFPTPVLTLWASYLLVDYYEKPCQQGALSEVSSDTDLEESSRLTQGEGIILSNMNNGSGKNNSELEGVIATERVVEPEVEFHPLDYVQPERRPVEDIPTENSDATTAHHSV